MFNLVTQEIRLPRSPLWTNPLFLFTHCSVFLVFAVRSLLPSWVSEPSVFSSQPVVVIYYSRVLYRVSRGNVISPAVRRFH